VQKALNRAYNPGHYPDKGAEVMLNWAILFLLIALVAAFFGFGVVAGTAATIARVLFVLFLVLFVASLIFGRRSPVL
jgi:uncharacterized membrane protein YtjA (UPF0391 family)